MTDRTTPADAAEVGRNLLSARRAPGTGALVLAARDEIADGVVLLTLEDAEGERLAPWTPGSHIDLILPTGTVRQYSLCGDRYDGFRYQVAVLREPDGRGGSQWIHEHARPGQRFEFGGPRNHFPQVPAEQYLFVAGGIGITPLLPMIEQAVHLDVPWRLLYGGRSRGTMAFADQLTSAHSDRVVLAPHDEVGIPDIASWLGPPVATTRIYTCGPLGLIEAVRNACSDWAPYTFHSERFVADTTSDTPDRPFEVTLARTGKTVTVAEGQSVLDALNETGIAILSSCRQGTCGTCEVAVLAGTPDHRDSVLNDTDRAASDCIITCVSRATTERLVLDI